MNFFASRRCVGSISQQMPLVCVLVSVQHEHAIMNASNLGSLIKIEFDGGCSRDDPNLLLKSKAFQR